MASENVKIVGVTAGKRQKRSEAERVDDMIGTLRAIGAKAYMASDGPKADACLAAVAALQHLRTFK